METDFFVIGFAKTPQIAAKFVNACRFPDGEYLELYRTMFTPIL
jgi:hypothetical protein